ncbi:hypothetical protein [Lysobacter sp. Root690]|uniref:hypothetical protein n=1 Tax=Lysobacter sp. Root690 TaxID=1736588 RepID=UPI0012FA2A4D|nr:hypothetical protein [Lysobacter sp. Root690]
MSMIVVCGVSLALAACESSTHGDATPAAPTPTAAAAPTASASGAATETVIPAGFSSYASESIGDGRQCVVGAAVDQDGMNQKPVVYIEQTSGKPVWTRTLELPKDTYQSRATHCLHLDDALYVLLQSDTQPQQSLSQTLLRVVKLDAGNGAVRGGGDVEVPGAQDAYSAVVAEGAQHLRWSDDQLIVAGQYFLLDTPDQRIDFQAQLKADLGR